MITPALEINKTDTHKAIITSIETNDFSRKLSDFVNQLDERLIAWADYIIFPSLFSDVSYLMQAIKTLNPSVQLVMDLDRNYFAIPVSIPLSRKLKTEKLKSLENNLGLMDIVTVANETFQKFLQRFIDNRLENANTFVQYLPSLVSRYGYEEMPPLSKNASKKLRIGLIKPTEEDLLSLKEVLFKMRKTFGDQIEFIYFGKPYSVWEVEKLFKDYKVEIHPTVSFLDYFEKLNSLQLDGVLLPALECLFNRHQNHQLFMELSTFGIPVIASSHYPVKKWINNGENGFLASEAPEWLEALETLVKYNKEKNFSSSLIKNIWNNNSFTKTSIDKITSLYI
ncbi:glycosyltransferase [Winogradskyella echinorum]|uniref:Glycosyltransferase n=2 Tax=Winogradskyella TaxID=286104 RepID=A0ABR6XX41_9FLAO|nr:glycosyltransferase [Winogradskyella echinorum]MBC5749312.1 glycosyltransferase [Winogradskyella echinorum]